MNGRVSTSLQCAGTTAALCLSNSLAVAPQAGENLVEERGFSNTMSENVEVCPTQYSESPVLNSGEGEEVHAASSSRTLSRSDHKTGFTS